MELEWNWNGIGIIGMELEWNRKTWVKSVWDCNINILSKYNFVPIRLTFAIQPIPVKQAPQFTVLILLT